MQKTPKKPTPKKVETPKSAKTPKGSKTPNKAEEPQTELQLEYDNEYNLNYAKVEKFVQALLKIHEGKKINAENNEKTVKKSKLFGAEDTPINLQISAIKIPKDRSEEHTLNSSHITISYAVFCLKKKNQKQTKKKKQNTQKKQKKRYTNNTIY